MQWFKADKYDDEKRTEISAEKGKFVFYKNKDIQKALFFIVDAEVEDSGVYFCRIDNTSGPGTAVNIASKWLGQHASSLLKHGR